jgi:ankyrin repeat protein
MHLAAEKGKYIRLRPFLAGNVDAPDANGHTALGLAASNGHLRCVTMLLDAKANVDGVSLVTRLPTPLMMASHYGHLDVVNALIEARADLNFVLHGRSPLHWACDCPISHPIVAALLAAGALVDVPGADHAPLIGLVYSREPEETLKLLIAAGADVNSSAYDMPPLSAFAGASSIAAVKVLLDAKADVNARNHSFDNCPLLAALSFGHLEMVNLLISAGADVTVRNSVNSTCLHLLVALCVVDGRWTRITAPVYDMNPNVKDKINSTPCDYPGILKALVDAKADINARSAAGMTPLIAATSKNNVEAVSALLAAGADPNDVGDIDMSALLIASSRGCQDAVCVLIAAGADVNCVTSYGTPLGAAVESNNVDVVCTLIAAGADVNHAPHDRTPLDIALSDRHDAIVTVLKEAGAITWLNLMVRTNELLSIDSTSRIILNTELIDKASDIDKENTLKVSVALNSLTMVKSLLAAGANPLIRFRTKDLLSFASIKGYTDIVRELIDAGADITFKDRDGMTALQHAAKNKHREIVAMLLAKAKELKNANK